MCGKRQLVALTGVMLVLAGCGSSTQSDAQSDEIQQVDMSPAAKGELDEATWATNTAFRTANPYQTVDSQDAQVSRNVCESLLRVDPESLEIVPNLAEQVTQPDPKTIKIAVRKGVKFFDGKPLTAEDVAYSLNENLNPQMASVFSVWFDRVRSIRATGPLEVTVTLKQPDYLLPSMFATPAGAVGEKAFMQRAGADFGTSDTGVMCTGPYRFASWEPGGDVVLERNERYWNQDLRGKVKRIRFTAIDNDSTMTAALQSGKVDGTYDVPTASLESLTTAGKVYIAPSTAYLALMVTDLNGPLGDAKVREALSKVVDVSGVEKTVFHGTHEPAHAIATPATWSYGKEVFQKAWDDLPAPAYDVDAAKALLSEAGTRSRDTITIAYSSGHDGMTGLANAVLEGAKAADLKVELRDVPAQTFVDYYFDPKARAGVDAMLGPNFPDVPDPLQVYLYWAVPGAVMNFAEYDNPQVTELLDQARATSDPDDRAELVVQAQQILTENKVWIPLLAMDNRLFLNDRVTGAPVRFFSLNLAGAPYLGAP